MNEREFTVTEKLFIILAWKCNGMSMGAAYESWNDHYVKKNTIEYWKDSSNQLQDWTFEIADLQQVSLEHLKFLGFRNWKKNHMLLPLWLYPQMRAEENGWFSILRDEEVGLTPETDLDVRGGCLAIYFKHEPVSVIVEDEPERDSMGHRIDGLGGLDPDAEAFINGMSGGDDDEVIVHPLRDDEHQ